MRAARMVLALAGVAVLALSACGRSDRTPQLMNIRSNGTPDEFAIIPPRALQMPEDLAALPEPTPGGSNLTDPNPQADAIAALGGKAPAIGGGAPVADGALIASASRYGTTAGIRETLAAEDLEWRRKNNGRLLERLASVNVYYKAYAEMQLDQQAELWRWRQAGARTPSAPPPQDGEE